MLKGPQEIPRNVWDQQVGYHVYKTSPLVLFLSQINSLHAIPVYFFMIHFSIILPCTPVYSSGFFTAGFRTKYLSVYLSPIKYVHIVISAGLSSVAPFSCLFSTDAVNNPSGSAYCYIYLSYNQKVRHPRCIHKTN